MKVKIPDHEAEIEWPNVFISHGSSDAVLAEKNTRLVVALYKDSEIPPTEVGG